MYVWRVVFLSRFLWIFERYLIDFGQYHHKTVVKLSVFDISKILQMLASELTFLNFFFNFFLESFSWFLGVYGHKKIELNKIEYPGKSPIVTFSLQNHELVYNHKVQAVDTLNA